MLKWFAFCLAIDSTRGRSPHWLIYGEIVGWRWWWGNNPWATTPHCLWYGWGEGHVCKQ